MSVPTVMRGKHKQCGGTIMFRPETYTEDLVAGRSVTLQAVCDRCAAIVAVEYALGTAPRMLWVRHSPASTVSSDVEDSAEQLEIPRSVVVESRAGAKRGFEAPQDTGALQDTTVRQELLVGTGAGDAWTAVSQGYGAGSSAPEQGFSSATDALAAGEVFAGASGGTRSIGGRGAALPGHRGGGHQSLFGDSGGERQRGDEHTSDVELDAVEADRDTVAADPALSPVYASQFAHRFAAARDAVRRVQDELPQVLADETWLARPDLSLDMPLVRDEAGVAAATSLQGVEEAPGSELMRDVVSDEHTTVGAYAQPEVYAQPVAPAEYAQPEVYAQPVAPAEPVGYAQPAPVVPAEYAQPEVYAQPVAPAEYAQPEGYAQSAPVVPAEYAQPVAPAEPVGYAQPAAVVEHATAPPAAVIPIPTSHAPSVEDVWSQAPSAEVFTPPMNAATPDSLAATFSGSASVQVSPMEHAVPGSATQTFAHDNTHPAVATGQTPQAMPPAPTAMPPAPTAMPPAPSAMPPAPSSMPPAHMAPGPEFVAAPAGFPIDHEATHASMVAAGGVASESAYESARGFDWEGEETHSEASKNMSGARLKVLVALLIIAIIGSGWIVVRKVSNPGGTNTAPTAVPSKQSNTPAGGVPAPKPNSTQPPPGEAADNSGASQPRTGTGSGANNAPSTGSNGSALNDLANSADTAARTTNDGAANDPFAPSPR